MNPYVQQTTIEENKNEEEGLEPWGLTKEGKEELEEIAARKAAAKAPPKEDTTIFMGELEQGLDENAE